MYTMTPEPISTAYFINPSRRSRCLYMYPQSLLGNGSVKILSLLGNGSVKTLPLQRTHSTIEELLDASFSMRSVSYQGKQTISYSQNFLSYNGHYFVHPCLNAETQAHFKRNKETHPTNFPCASVPDHRSVSTWGMEATPHRF
jgi:hypothetical protein